MVGPEGKRALPEISNYHFGPQGSRALVCSNLALRSSPELALSTMGGLHQIACQKRSKYPEPVQSTDMIFLGIPMAFLLIPMAS